jgi:hypothetical protein
MDGMEATPSTFAAGARAPSPGRFRAAELSIWLACCVLLALLVAWAAVVARAHVAPLGLFPLIVGAVLGGTLVLAMRVFHVGHRRTLCAGALVAGLLTVAGEHYFSFWKARQVFAQDVAKLANLQLVAPERIPPADFGQFMIWSAAEGLPILGFQARGGLAWLFWSIDGLLVLLPTVVLVTATGRLPYCNRCRRWYHTMRSGRIDSPNNALLGALADTSSGSQTAKGRYRLIVCQGGCGPTGLVLAGEDATGQPSSGTVWLSAADRQRVVETLDQLSRLDVEDEAAATNPQPPAPRP